MGVAISDNDFVLFDLPARFAVDRDALDARWKALQAEVHPDRFAAHDTAAQRLAMQWAVRVNEAYQRLKDPLRRAAYLCELQGVAIDAENNTAMPASFLMQQMAWRETLDEASDAAAVEALADEVTASRQRRLDQLARTIDALGDWPAAALVVRELMFVDRFADDLRKKLDRLDA